MKHSAAVFQNAFMMRQVEGRATSNLSPLDVAAFKEKTHAFMGFTTPIAKKTGVYGLITAAFNITFLIHDGGG